MGGKLVGQGRILNKVVSGGVGKCCTIAILNCGATKSKLAQMDKAMEIGVQQ